jgi:hypothetical protein
MTKRLLLAVASSTVLALISRSAGTAALTQAAGATRTAVASIRLVAQSHGCNRACRLGRVGRWGGVVRLHRHVGPSCVPVRC